MNISDFHMGRSSITDDSFQRGKKSRGFLAVVLRVLEKRHVFLTTNLTYLNSGSGEA